MSLSLLRRYGTVVGLVVATAGLPAVPATARPATAAGAPTIASLGTSTSVVPLTSVRLTPGWLPDGYVAQPATTDHVPAESGLTAITFTTTRYAVPVAEGEPVRDVLYVEVAHGGSGELTGPGEEAASTTVGDRPAVYVPGEVREYRFSLADLAPGVTATVGAHGLISDDDLHAFADELIATVIPFESIEIPMVVPGDSTVSNTNMKGSGSTLTNDWGETDGANVQISQRSTDVYKGNVVGVWQAIMWADRATFYTPETNVTERYKSCQVDGGFGLITTRATYWEQDRFGLIQDGIVGPLTWSKVDNYLAYKDDLVVYRGLWETLYFRRQASAPGNYSWSWNFSSYRYTGYYDVTLAKTSTCT